MENFNEPRIELPNSSLILAFGIVSIVGCCCSDGLLGVIFGIITLVLANTATKRYIASPEKYTEGSYKNVNAGKICAWIGLIPSIIVLTGMIIVISTLGWAALMDPSIIYNHYGIEVPF